MIKYGFSLVKGKANHPMEDYHVAKFVQIEEHELGLFAIYDGHLGDRVPLYLQKHLFSNILKEVVYMFYIYIYILSKYTYQFQWGVTLHFLVQSLQEEFWVDPGGSISNAYEKTDQAILANSSNLGRGGSTAVTAILINGRRLWIANVGDSRAVLSKGGQAIQMTTDHEPNTERGSIENRGGFVSNMPGSSQLLFLEVYCLHISLFQILHKLDQCVSEHLTGCNLIIIILYVGRVFWKQSNLTLLSAHSHLLEECGDKAESK